MQKKKAAPQEPKAAPEPKAAEPKAAVAPKASPAPAAKTVAEPKASAAAKAPAEATATPPPAASAEAAPKKKAQKPKAAAEPKDAEPQAAVPKTAKAQAAKTAAAPKAAAPKAAAEAEPKAPKPPKSAPAAPKTAAAKAPAVADPKAAAPAAKSSAASAPPAAKKKPKAAAAPPPAAPAAEADEEGWVEQDTKKKKKKSTKKAEEGDEAAPPAQEKPRAAQASSAPKTAVAHVPEVVQLTGQELADAAEKDADFRAIKAKVGILESSIASRHGTPASWKKEAEGIKDEIEKFLNARKVKKPKDASAEMLALSIDELKENSELEPEEKAQMVQDLQTRLEEARAYEAFAAMRTKVNAVKARVDTALESIVTKAATSAASSSPAGAGDDREGEREAGLIKKLAGERDTEGLQLHKKSFELEEIVLKYLFTAPYNFRVRFERDFPVLIFQGRPSKGAGKGGKGSSGSKEVIVYSLSSAEVEKCFAALKALDFSGTATKEVSKACFDTGKKVRDIEQEFHVIIFKQKDTVTICGKREHVQKAFLKGEETKTPGKLSNVISLEEHDKAKALNPKLESFQKSTGAKVFVPSSTSGPSKVVIQGDTQEVVDAGTKEVKKYLASLVTKLVPGDVSKVKPAAASSEGNGSPSSGLSRRYKDITSDKSTVIITKRDEGFLLTGPEADVLELKAQLSDLLKKADFKPQKVEVPAEKVRVFSKENLAKISETSGADVRRGPGRDSTHLVVIGDDAAVERAKEEINKVMESEKVAVTDDVVKLLLVNKKINDMEKKHAVNMTIDKAAKEIVILGSRKAIQAAIDDLKDLEKAEKDSTFREIQLTDGSVIRRIIGTKGSVLRNIESTTSTKVQMKDKELKVEVRGSEAGVAKAVEMINEIIGGSAASAASWASAGDSSSSPTPSPKRKAAAESPPKSQKKAEEFKGSDADFPTLAKANGAQDSNGRSSGPWGPQDEAGEEKGGEE